MALISTHDKTFQLQQGETLLEGLERTGHEVEYQCRSGYCGSCRVKILDGKVSYDNFHSLLSRPEKFCRAAAGLLKTSSLIVGSASKSRIYLMSIYLKTNKKCRLNIVAEIFDFMSTVQTAFYLSNLIYVRQSAKPYGRKIR